MSEARLSFGCTEEPVTASDALFDYEAAAKLEAEAWDGSLDGEPFFTMTELQAAVWPQNPEEWREYATDTKLLAMFGAVKARFDAEVVLPRQAGWDNLMEVLERTTPLGITLPHTPDTRYPGAYTGDWCDVNWRYHYRQIDGGIKSIDVKTHLQPKPDDDELIDILGGLRAAAEMPAASDEMLTGLTARIPARMCFVAVRDEAGGDYDRALSAYPLHTDETDRIVPRSTEHMEDITRELTAVLDVGSVRSQAVLRGETEARRHFFEVRNAIRSYRYNEVDDARMLEALNTWYVTMPNEKELRELEAINEVLRYNASTTPVVNYAGPLRLRKV